jgi:hypothetical protein
MFLVASEVRPIASWIGRTSAHFITLFGIHLFSDGRAVKEMHSNHALKQPAICTYLRLHIKRRLRTFLRREYKEHVIYRVPMGCYHHAVHLSKCGICGQIRTDDSNVNFLMA